MEYIIIAGLSINSARRKRVNKVVCKDGAKLSIQASETHYCTPRNNYGPYTHVEVGYVTGAILPLDWKKYAGTGDLDSDVFAWVPVELVEQFIMEHGGIDLGKTLAVKRK